MRLTIGNKIIFVLLLIGLFSTLSTGRLDYLQAKKSIQDASFARLTAIREARKQQIEAYFKEIHDQALLMSDNLMIINAMEDFSTNANKLANNSPIAHLPELKTFYRDSFLPHLHHGNIEDWMYDFYWPQDNTGKAMQALYIGANHFPLGSKDRLDTPGDKSAYSRTHAKYHPVIRNYLQKMGFYDIFLIDNSGRIVYSVFKETDFGTNILTGPYSSSNLGIAYQAAQQAQSSDFSFLIDFAPYEPSFNKPAAFISTPIFKGKKRIGCLVFQVSIGKINKVMTGNNSWQKEGLGKSGETYIVGGDFLMRNDSRFLIEDKPHYLRTIAEAGLNQNSINAITTHSTSVLLQEVRSKGAEEAFAGKTGTMITKDYRHVNVLSSYTPLEIKNVHWVLLAEINAAEAFAPVHALKHQLFKSTLLISLIIIIISLLLTKTLTRPIKKLAMGIHKFGQGNLDQRLQIHSRDEIGELADSFNQMAEKLQATTITKDYFDNVVTSMTEILLVVSVDTGGTNTVITTVNKAASSLLGYSEQELIGQPIDILFYTIKDADIFHNGKFNELLKTGSYRGLERLCRTKTGIPVPVLISASVMPTINGANGHNLVVVAQDITSLKSAETELRQKEASLAAAQRIANLGNWELDLINNEIVIFSDEACRIFGSEPKNFVASFQTFQDAIHPDDRLKVLEAIEEIRNDKKTTFQLNHRIMRPNGLIRIVHQQAEIQYDNDKKPVKLIGIVHDITEKRQAKDRLRLTSKVFENSNEAIIITDLKANILEVNKAFSTMSEYGHDEVIGKNTRILRSNQHDDDFYREMWEILLNSNHWEGEIWDRKKSGEIFPVWLSITAVKDDQGLTTHYAAIMSDLTNKKQAENSIQMLTNYDILTGLPNNVLFQDRLKQAFIDADHHDNLVATIFLDLDDFKVVNDSLGLKAGDQMLMEAAGRLKACLKEGDTLARMGGDDFAIALPNINKADDAAKIAKRMMETLSKTPFILEQQEVYSNASVGIAIYPVDGKEVDTILKNSDAAVFHAKSQGKNNYQFYSADINATILERLELETALRQALTRNEFNLFYQPKVDLTSGEMHGMEALIRWTHPEKGMISPVKFIPMAEDTGLILPIGEWTVFTACRDNKKWLDAGYPPLKVSVNLSARQLKENVPDLVRRALAETGLPPELLELELTEGMVMKNAEDVIQTMHDLKEIGIGLSIDDFGTGYSSLSYLKRFPIDVLKIDQSFIRHLTTDQDDAAIATAVISLAKSLRLKVIAEGVEESEHVTFLRDLKCDQMQGYFFSKPLPVEEFTQLLNEGRNLNDML
ncbi:MAG: EAL domain-containing protein [Desulfobulbaceae bacterium]|nr:EAL domain-containing protein [Desulfobulbaceae bacterium]